jgi:uncharacterized metal-binding protein YceD (DUF177 family)
MKIPVSQLSEGQTPFRWDSATSPELALFYKHQASRGYALVGTMRVDIDLTRLEPDYYLRGKMAFQLEQTCAHCGESLQVPVEGKFELALLRTDKTRNSGPRLSEEADDLDLVCFAGNELLLDPLLEEQFVLNVPVQATCNTAECLERTRVLMQKVHSQAEHWKDNSPFSVLQDLKKRK